MRRWRVPAGLVALSLVPVGAGAFRLAARSGNGTALVIHIVAAASYALLGAFQFAPALRGSWHRLAGKLVVVAGIATALSGLWMTLYYPWAANDGLALYAMRLLVGIATLAFIGNGIAAVLRRDLRVHSASMAWSYALALGAGMQVFTHLPIFLFPLVNGELARALAMGGGWAINLAVVAVFFPLWPGPLVHGERHPDAMRPKRLRHHLGPRVSQTPDTDSSWTQP